MKVDSIQNMKFMFHLDYDFFNFWCSNLINNSFNFKLFNLIINFNNIYNYFNNWFNLWMKSSSFKLIMSYNLILKNLYFANMM
uniref:NADH dehydrogenase subunit 3 n=1 Tax=Neomikiella lychnidis TaxID=2719079 RepID=A0A7L7S0L1_9DIPT|nr:NADH dehydrogenase subunit 3 [Neomikiella lychnidis]